MAEESHDVDGLVTDVGDAIRRFLDEPLTPAELERLKRTLYEGRTVYEDVLTSDCSYLLIGSYGTEERERVEIDRLERVRFVLDNRHDGHHAFLLRDVPTLAENFVLTFYVLALRVDYVVGVFEHNEGGHEFEIGLVAPTNAADVWALKREYDTEAAERDAYDAMLAHYFELLDERGRLLTWESEDELLEVARNGVPGLDDGMN